MFTLIQHGELYTPEPSGTQSILLVGDKIAKIGQIDERALMSLDLPCNIIDATGCYVMPGLIDPHEHLIGAGGEHGFATRMPEVMVDQIVSSGITTVVGCIGTDMATRFHAALLGKVRQLQAEGISAYMYTGGYSIPPQTLTHTITDDLVMIPEVIGCGELAIADERSSEPTFDELGRLIAQSIAGGMIAGKAGVTHFHVGPGKRRLSLLRTLLDGDDTPPQYVYPTHINRSEALMREAIDLAKRGCFVDIDTVDDDLPLQLRAYCELHGPLEQLTVSSDAHTPGGSPARHYANFVAAAQECDLPLEDVLRLFTANPAKVLQLKDKGRLEAGRDADILVVRRETLEIVHVVALGQQMVRDGQIVRKSDDEAA